MGSDGTLSLMALALATLAGGLAASFGINLLIRGALGRRFLARWRAWGVFLYALAILGIVAVGVPWIFLRVVRGVEDPGALVASPWLFLALGFVGGLPFTIPVLVTGWRAHHAGKQHHEQRKATAQDRIAFASDLERQIREFVGADREIRVELGGEERSILYLRGDITRHQAERLVAALRAELQGAAFARVEGGAKGANWWVRV